MNKNIYPLDVMGHHTMGWLSPANLKAAPLPEGLHAPFPFFHQLYPIGKILFDIMSWFFTSLRKVETVSY
jgi:hypothetical protein